MTEIKTRTDVLWSGENPILLLKPSADEKETTAVGFYRVDYSPQGSGHALFIDCDLGIVDSGPSRVFACYTDNVPMAEWLRDKTIGTLPEFENTDFSKAPMKAASFAGVGDTRNSRTELISTPDGEIRLTWAKLQAPFNLHLPVGSVPSIPFEINTILYAALEAEVVIDGKAAPGQAFPDSIGSQPHSTTFLALSETWYG